MERSLLFDLFKAFDKIESTHKSDIFTTLQTFKAWYLYKMVTHK